MDYNKKQIIKENQQLLKSDKLLKEQLNKYRKKSKQLERFINKNKNKNKI
jgi:hypothetical protein